jgi:hypothetical protein
MRQQKVRLSPGDRLDIKLHNRRVVVMRVEDDGSLIVEMEEEAGLALTPPEGSYEVWNPS